MRVIACQFSVVLVCFLLFGACRSKSEITTETNPSQNIIQASPSPAPLPVSSPFPPNTTHKPRLGYVPDAVTAIKIAEAVWIPIYGEETLKDEKPFTARLVNGVWIVQGTLPKGWDGGTAYAEISKETGCVLNVTHFK